MPLEFESFQIENVEDLVAGGRFGWATVYFSFTDPQSSAHPSIEIRAPVQYGRDWTIDAVRAAAFALARDTIAAALSLADRHRLAGLQQLVDERRAAEAARLAAPPPADPPSL